MGWFSGTGEVLPELHALLSPFSPAMNSDALNSSHLGILP